MTRPFALVVSALALVASAPARGHAQASEAPRSVQEFVVTAERPASQTLIDRKVYSVTTDLRAGSGSAADVLNNIPSVVVDSEGAIAMRGDANVAILVDGKPSAQFAGPARGLSLLQFPASDIDRVEVLTNPPARFKAEGSGGVINIVTKKTAKAGLSGGAQANLGDKRRYVLGLNGAYNTGRLKVSGGIGLRQEAKERLVTYDRISPDTTTGAPIDSLQSLDEQFRRLIPLVRGDLDYELSETQSIGGSFSHRELTGDRGFDQHNESGPTGGVRSRISDRHSDGHEWSVDESQGLHFDQKLGRPGETLSLALQHSVTRERERYAYSNLATAPPGPATFDDLRLSLDLVKLEFSADYALPLANGRDLKLGYAIEDDRNAFDNVGDTIDPISGAPVLDPSVSNHFRYRQQVSAVYGEYQAPLGAWRLQAGLRLEDTHVSTLQVTGGISGGRDDFGAYPSLHLERELGQTSRLFASLGRRVTRPDPEALNPFSDHQDVHTLRAGNPDLRPQETWSSEVGYSSNFKALTYGVTAYYRSDRNSVTDIVVPIGPDVVLVTKANLPLRRSQGLEFSLNGKLAPQVSLNASGDLFRSEIDASALGAVGLRSTTGLNLKASLDYRPTDADTLQVSFTRSDKRLTPQGEIAAINILNLGYRRQLRADLALVATLSDALDSQRNQRLISTPQLREDYQRHQYGQVGYLGVVYTFGAQRKGKSGFDYEP